MKKLLALTLALVMVLTLAACGGKTDAPSTSAPPEVTPSDENSPADGSETESEVPVEADPEEAEPAEPEEVDPLLLSFDFPNSCVGDDGTKNPPKYIVTLHGGAEVEMEPEVKSKIVKLDGFGKTSNVSNSAALNIFGGNGEETLEFQKCFSHVHAAGKTIEFYLPPAVGPPKAAIGLRRPKGGKRRAANSCGGLF